MSHEITLRLATLHDARQLLAIYTPYVTETAITFEYTVPTLAEFASRIERTLSKYPYLVAEQNGHIVGYAYATAFKERAAYDWSVETSIYIDQNRRSGGIGGKLYGALEDILKRQNIINVNACIAYPNPESIGFHQHLGYRQVAHFTKCGYKHHTWYDMVWLEKMLIEHPQNPQPVIPLPQLKPLLIP